MKNWYIQCQGPVILLCGDRLIRPGYRYERDVLSYRYEQFGFLRVTKVVSSGIQCEVVSKTGESLLWNCRWDHQDRHFRATAKKLPELLAAHGPRLDLIAEMLQSDRVSALYEDQKSRQVRHE